MIRTVHSAACPMISCDTVITDAGPRGPLQAFGPGLDAHAVDAVPAAAGPCTQPYPDQPIRDIPTLPPCRGRESTGRPQRRIRPFAPRVHPEHVARSPRRTANGRFDRRIFAVGDIPTRPGMPWRHRSGVHEAGRGSAAQPPPRVAASTA